MKQLTSFSSALVLGAMLVLGCNSGDAKSGSTPELSVSQTSSAGDQGGATPSDTDKEAAFRRSRGTGGSSANSSGTGGSSPNSGTGGSPESSSDGTTMGTPQPGSVSSLEFGRVLYGNDYAVRGEAPSGGTLFSVWTKILDPGPIPWSRGNMDVYLLYGDNWHLRCLVGNSGANSPTSARLNANSMFFVDPSNVWVGDFSYYDSGYVLTDAKVRGWVWAAWQVVVNADSFDLRQWLKLGIDGEVLAAGTSHLTFTEIRANLVSNYGWTQSKADAWLPSEATRFQVGSDDGNLCHAKMKATNVVPGLDELDDMARANAADTSAWADYELNWDAGMPNFLDRSGHARHLTLQAGGKLFEGEASPKF